MTIFEITADLKALEQLIDQAFTDENGEPREPSESEKETLKAYIDEIQGSFEDKAERICKFLRNQEALAVACKDEEDRINRVRKSRERKAGVLKHLLEYAMIRAGIKKTDAGIFQLAIQKNPPSVQITSEEKLPSQFFKIIPETKSPDKAAIATALKSGEEVPGAYLLQVESLRIKG